MQKSLAVRIAGFDNLIGKRMSLTGNCLQFRLLILVNIPNVVLLGASVLLSGYSSHIL
jgi:hypothetical protein